MADLNNLKVLESEKDLEFDGLCGTEYGVLWEDSLDQFFIYNNIDILNYSDNYITLRQGDVELSFRIFMGTEGSVFTSEHIDFNTIVDI